MQFPAGEKEARKLKEKHREKQREERRKGDQWSPPVVRAQRN